MRRRGFGRCGGPNAVDQVSATLPCRRPRLTPPTGMPQSGAHVLQVACRTTDYLHVLQQAEVGSSLGTTSLPDDVAETEDAAGNTDN